jgi:hypothetical protein
VGDWPLNVFSDADATAELPTLQRFGRPASMNAGCSPGYRLV